MAATDFEQKNDVPELARKRAVDKINENWDEIIQGQIELAKGIWVEQEVMNKEGVLVDVKVYQKEPSKDAAQYLANQVIGKPKESMNIEGKVNLIIDE